MATALLLFALTGCAATPPSRAPDSSAETARPFATLDGAVKSPRLARLLARAPAESANAERTALTEFAYPKTGEEHNAMGGHGLLRVTAISRHAVELPLARVYARGNNGEFELIRVATITKNIADTEPALARRVGEYLYDAVYLMPVAAAYTELTLVAEFAGDGGALELARFPVLEEAQPLPPGVPILPNLSAPDTGVLRAMVARDFPVR